MHQILRDFFSDGVMAKNLGCDWVLLSSQRFKRRLNIILYISLFDWFPLDIPKELEIIYDSSLSIFGGESTIINLKSSNDLSLLCTIFFYFSEEYAWLFFGNTPLIILDLVIVFLCCFSLRFIFIWFIWYKLPRDISILMSWLNYIK